MSNNKSNRKKLAKPKKSQKRPLNPLQHPNLNQEGFKRQYFEKILPFQIKKSPKKRFNPKLKRQIRRYRASKNPQKSKNEKKTRLNYIRDIVNQFNT